MQVRRLESAIRKENKQESTGKVDPPSPGKKRSSEAENGDGSCASKKVKADDGEGADKADDGIDAFCFRFLCLVPEKVDISYLELSGETCWFKGNEVRNGILSSLFGYSVLVI